MEAKIGPEKSLPYDTTSFASSEEYVDSLLNFIGENELLRTLCGGVHILDFFTSGPPIYDQVLPQEWRDFFANHEIMDLLDLFMREDLDQFSNFDDSTGWRDGPTPPASLPDYLKTVRKHLLDRKPSGNQCTLNRKQKLLSRHVSVGMTVKKVHEVGLMASYINSLASSISTTTGQEISHLIDFGSGQNYLGRALASQPYNRDVVAIESKPHNSERAKDFDVKAKLVKRERLMRNKKLFRAGAAEEGEPEVAPPPIPTVKNGFGKGYEVEGGGSVRYVAQRILGGDLGAAIPKSEDGKGGEEPGVMVISLHSCGNLVHHGLHSLTLNPAVKAVAMVGCCYNLLTERLSPASYKLPELRPTTHMHPRLRPHSHTTTSPNTTEPDPQNGETCEGDPSGFPLSTRLALSHIRLNITARMMAVQAPFNWGPNDSENFFTRHFYRALLQRIFLDYGVVGKPSRECVGGAAAAGSSEMRETGMRSLMRETGPNVSPAGHTSKVLSGGGSPGGGPAGAGGPGGPPFGTPITIGSLRKGCYGNFVAYFRGAYEKLVSPLSSTDANSEVSAASVDLAKLIQDKLSSLTNAELEEYEAEYLPRKKDLSVIWSLMAFSAGVIEAAIVLDRYCWLREQEEVRECWVESVFDYGVSPRNLVVVGVKGEQPGGPGDDVEGGG